MTISEIYYNNYLVNLHYLVTDFRRCTVERQKNNTSFLGFLIKYVTFKFDS